MSDDPVDLDKHRGMSAQKQTDIRRVLADVEANARRLREGQQELEVQLLATPCRIMARRRREGALRVESVPCDAGWARHSAS